MAPQYSVKIRYINMYVLYFFMLMNVLFMLKTIPGVMKKLVEWITYSLDIENAQQLPIAVS